MGWPAIQGYEDGESVVKDVLNRPLNQLAQRTEYLRQRLADNDRTKVTVVASFDGNTPARGTPVVCTGTDGKFAVAAADTAQYEWFYAAGSAMAVGVVGDTDDVAEQTRVVLYGRIDFARASGDDDPGIPVGDLIVDAGTPETGRYYLAPETPDGRRGMLTQHPNGPVIYVCTCIISGGYITAMLVSPQYRDTGESHVHREIVMSGLPLKGKASRSRTRDTDPWVYTSASCIYPDGQTSGTGLVVAGTWVGPDAAEYIVRAISATELAWTVGDDSGTTALDSDKTARIGPDVNGEVYVHLAGAPSAGETWTLNLPVDGRAWVKCDGGFMCNLGFYGNTGLVPAVPNNAAALVTDGLELRSARYGGDRQWDFLTTGQLPGGPWVKWVGDSGAADNVVTPFRNDAWAASGAGEKTVTSRFISFHTNRMMVGPTGFVTSLQVEPGSPLRITDALSGAGALQGALMLGLSLDFDTVAHGVAGSEVVKAIRGSKFETGPVVERIVAGPGTEVDPPGGQGTVTISVGNAHYAGDFETIALKNAKQDVMGGIFPYTKLLPWPASGAVASGFTAKFRVPDYLPEGEYNVVVSASVFGEADVASGSTQVAAFALRSYVLPDYSLSPYGTGGVSTQASGHPETITVDFSGYTAFDPILVHGMPDVEDVTGHRQYRRGLLLKEEDGIAAIKVKPGYFVGLEIARQGTPGGSAVPYVPALGFLSLRWNLVRA